jgi:hypothetical protein
MMTVESVRIGADHAAMRAVMVEDAARRDMTEAADLIEKLSEATNGSR